MVMPMPRPIGKVPFALQVFEGIEGIDTTRRLEEMDPADTLGFMPPHLQQQELGATT